MKPALSLRPYGVLDHLPLKRITDGRVLLTCARSGLRGLRIRLHPLCTACLTEVEQAVCSLQLLNEVLAIAAWSCSVNDIMQNLRQANVHIQHIFQPEQSLTSTLSQPPCPIRTRLTRLVLPSPRHTSSVPTCA